MSRVKVPGVAGDVASAIQKNHVFWLDYIFGRDNKLFFDPFPPLWYNISQRVCCGHEFGLPPITILAIVRGIGKTSVFTIGHNVWRLFEKGRSNNFVIGGDKEKISDTIKNISYLLHHPAFLEYYYGTDDPRVMKGTPWQESTGNLTINVPDKTDPSGFRKAFIGVRGFGQPVYGKNIEGSRIDTLYLDDTTSDHDAKSPNLIKRTEDRNDKFWTELQPAITEKDASGRCGETIFIDTFKEKGDMLSYAIANWKYNRLTKIVVPAIADTKEVAELASGPGNKVEVGDSIWEDRKPIEGLLLKKRNMPKRSWNSQFRMVDVKSGRDYFPDQYRVEITPRTALNRINNGSGKIVTIVDSAYTEKTTNDQSGITTVLHDGNKMLFLRAFGVYETEDQIYQTLLDIQLYYYNLLKDRSRYSAYIEYRQGSVLESYFSARNKIEVLENGLKPSDALIMSNIKECSALTEVSTRANSLVAFYRGGQVEFVKSQCNDLLAEMEAWTGVKMKNANDSILDSAAYQPGFLVINGGKVLEEKPKFSEAFVKEGTPTPNDLAALAAAKKFRFRVDRRRKYAIDHAAIGKRWVNGREGIRNVV